MSAETFEFVCPSCHGVCTLPITQIGQFIPCPLCGQTIGVTAPESPPPKSVPKDVTSEQTTDDELDLAPRVTRGNVIEARHLGSASDDRDSGENAPCVPVVMRAETTTALAWVGFVLVVIGTMLPWVYVEPHMQRVAFSGGVQGFQQRTVGGFSMSGFRGKASVAGLSLPGWTVALAALVCALLVSTSAGMPAFSWACCIYGLLHVGFMAFALRSTPNMSPALGILVVVGGFVLQIWSLLSGRRVEPTSMCHTNAT